MSVPFESIATPAHRTVRARGGNLRPQQQHSNLRIKRSSDFRSQRMIKCAEICHFHSLAEYYFSALLEGDPQVQIYVPQPFRLYIDRKSYIPDIYYVRDSQAFVGELKARGVFDESRLAALTCFFRDHGMTFEVIDNEYAYSRSMAAQNWMTVVRWLLTYPDLDTEAARLVVLQLLLDTGEITYGEIADLGNRAARLTQECAVHRMLHAGEIEADFDAQFFSANTVLRLC